MRHLGSAMIALSLLTSGVRAATVYITPTITDVLDRDFSPVGPEAYADPALRILRPRPGSYYLLKVEVAVTITGLGDGAVGFANTAFDVTTRGGSLYSAPDEGLFAWQPHNPVIDSNGPAVDGLVTLWDINSDFGVNTNDARAIVLSGVTKDFGPAEFDIRRTLAQDADGELAGTFYIKLSGERSSYAYADVDAPFGASTYDLNGIRDTDGNTAIGGTTVWYSTVPEPASWAMLAAAMGVGSLLFCREVRVTRTLRRQHRIRRTFTSTGTDHDS